MTDDPKVLIITVNFQQADCTLQFIESAARLAPFDRCRLLIVDNNSSDDSAGRIREAIAAFSNADLLISSANLGYFGAARWALNQNAVTCSTPDWIIVCNNDIVFDDPQFLRRLLAINPQDVGVLAPAVISRLTGFDANPMILRRPGKLRRLRYRFLLSFYCVAWLAQWLAPAVRKGRRRLRGRRSDSTARTSSIYAPHGSFLIFTRRFFDNGGFLDDGCFLYAEELTVAETCHRLGLTIIHDPQLRVTHNDSQTTGRMLTHRMYSLQRQGLHYALAKYLGAGDDV